VIGLLNIFGPENAKIHREFLLPYTALALGVASLKKPRCLETFKIIRISNLSRNLFFSKAQTWILSLRSFTPQRT
jgi:hypothetical protein